ncbi:unnamed protein product [Mytilus coruscus]|uniref:C-type lectin domain-containing protein n=1 Tax=Mytilus coruscus TaxID=42192 RepID=A0A6J8AX36_MYTCO|nr:unnamed protein product [Mytilus coruscus]
MNKLLLFFFGLQTLSFLVLCSAEFAGNIYGIEQKTKFVTLNTSKISENNLVVCVLRCLSNEKCCAANYVESEDGCYLVDDDYCNDSLESDDDWKLVRIKLPQKTTIKNTTKEYIKVNEWLTWNEAQDYCVAWGGRLATVSSSDENELVKNLTDRLLPVWIGGSDVVSEDNWTWNEGTNAEKHNIQPTFWGPNQPDNLGSDQHCLRYTNFQHTTYAWDDMYCWSTYYFICEK